jgi:hypothetical protein
MNCLNMCLDGKILANLYLKPVEYNVTQD